MRIETQLMRGAGPLAVLKLLDERGEMYGYELVEALSARTGGVLDMGQATLYPLLYNLEAKGLVESRWAEAGTVTRGVGKGKARAEAAARARKYYALTGKGRARLAKDEKQWARLVEAMASLGVIGGGAARGAMA